MQTARPSKRHRLQLLLLVVLCIALISPIAVYVLTFGSTLTDNHTRWGEMGSAMSGIYTPILALLTLLVLAGQVAIQREVAVHEYDKAFIAEVRSDVEYFLSRLDQALAQNVREETTVREALNTSFTHLPRSELTAPKLVCAAKELNRRVPSLLGSWLAIYSRLGGLKVSSAKLPYRLTFATTKEKAIAVLSFDTCVALDQYVWCILQGRCEHQFQFSPHLTESA